MFTVQPPLDGVSLVVEYKHDRLQVVQHHSGQLLDRQLPK